MATGAWNDSYINVVGAQATKFPNVNVDHWNRLRTCIDGVRELLRDVNNEMNAIERDPDLKPQAIARKVTEAGKSAAAKLDNFTMLQLAEHAAETRIEKLQKGIREVLLRGEPKNPGEVAVLSEIRSHIRDQKDKAAMFAAGHRNDPRVVSAVLGAPAFLSGMTDAEVGNFRSAVLDSSDPANEQEQVERALDVCRAAIKHAQSMIKERAGIRKDPDGAWRHSSEAPRYAAAAE